MSSIFFKTFSPHENLPQNIIFPEQTHGNKIVEIRTGTENLSECDGIFTRNEKFLLGIKTADCAPIVFYDEKSYGVVHAGWRGLCLGILEKMNENFKNPKIFCGPILPEFEIQKDFCYEQISEKFGEMFFKFSSDKKILFNFHSAIKKILPTVQFDPRSTFKTPTLASWRRDKSKGRNVTIVGNQCFKD